MADRVFIFHETTDNFRSFQFDGTAQTGENWSPGFTTIRGAAANYTHIYVLDTSGSTAIARRFALDQTRQAIGDITMNSDDAYSGIALTPTHLVAINETDNKLEYYALSNKAYDSTKDVTLPSLTSPEYFSGICRSGDFLYLVTEDPNAPHTPHIYKRDLDGSAEDDWPSQPNTTALTIFATYNAINAVRKVGGHWDRWSFTGTQLGNINTIGSGVWAGSYTTFDLATVAFSAPVKLANGNYQFNATWTGGHTGFAQDDLSVNLGTISNVFQTPTPNVFQIEVTPPSTGMGSIELTVREDAVTEKNAETTFTVGTFDNTPPVVPATLSLSFPVAVLDHGETRTLTITSDKNVTLEAGDVTQTGGATLADFAGSNASYTVDVTAPTSGSGNIVINIAEDAVPEMNNAVSLTIPYRDIQAPTIASALAELVNGATTTALITFPNTVTTFGIGKISADAGTLSNFTVVTAGRVFRVTVTPPASGKGDITLSIAADVVPERNDAATLTIAYSYPATFTFSAPHAVLDLGETQRVTIDADQDVTNFVQADVTQTGGATFANFTKVSNSQYTVDVTAPATGAGDIVLSIAEDVVDENNQAATFTIAYRDITAPTIVFDRAALNDSETTQATITHPIAVTDFVEEDITIDGGGTLSDFTAVGTDNRVWTVNVTAPASGQGTITVRIATDVVPERNAAASASIAYSTPPPDPEDLIPNAPTDVSVDLTPTTALITWKAPTNGAPLTGYEISYAEGASPGTTWIPTESLSTRFFVKGLKRGTPYTWQVRGITENRTGTESSPVTERTPIASLHNALFFKECVNYFDQGARVSVHGDPSTLVREVADNDYNTSTTEKDLVINIAVNGQPTRVDAVFVKGIGIEGHSAVPTGGSGSGYSNRMMPETVKNWEGTDVSTVVNGFQHDLYLLDEHFTATSVRLTFTGTDAKITEIMLLEFGISIDANGDFTEIATNFVDRTGVIHSDPGGGIAYDSPIGDDRDKWQIDYVAKVVPRKTILQTPEAFLYWRSENRNHVHAQEPSRFPWRIFPATFVRKSVPVRYRTDDKTGGEIIAFQVSEQ